MKIALTPPMLWLILASQVLNILLLAEQLTPWMLAIIALTFCWRVLILHKQTVDNHQQWQTQKTHQYFKNAPKLILIVFAISGCIAIALTSTQLGVLISMIHLLSFAYALKVFEMKNRKDFFQLWLLGLFIIASAMIFQQGLGFTLIIVIILVFNFAILLCYFSSQYMIQLPSQTTHKQFTHIANPNKSTKTSQNQSFVYMVKTSMKTSGLLLLQSVVLAVVLFIVFPRLSPFWQVPIAKSAQTGLSDSVQPGDIANLALSGDLAFRVNFNDKTPLAYSTLYWRAMTLSHYDGRKWTHRTEKPNDKMTNVAIDAVDIAKGINYQIIVEPTFQHWLFALSLATSKDAKVNLVNDYSIQSQNIISQTTRYEMRSYLQAPLNNPLNENQRIENITYPKGSNPRLEQLASQLSKQYKNPRVLAQVVLNRFRQQRYFYTLKPPLLANNSLDQFFFETKAGFCVHYASAFTFIMRAAGIPARVVTGYLGGEYNANSQHLSVYQYDAHAWSEIWITGKGWQRIDPTAAVAPERVEQGLSTELLKQQASLSGDFFNLNQYKQFSWLNSLRLQIDALDYQWTQWVLSYSSHQQYQLLKKWFGDMLPWKTALIIGSAISVVLFFFWLGYQFSLRKKVIVKPVSAGMVLYQQALAKLKRKGIEKPKGMTVTEFSAHVEQQIPDCATSVNTLSRCLLAYNYQQSEDFQQSRIIAQMKLQLTVLDQTLSKYKNEK